MEQKQIFNEDLISNDIILHDVIIKHINKNIIRIIPISDNDNRNYYYMTDFLEPKTLNCKNNIIQTLDNKKYAKINFYIRKKNNINDEECNNDVNLDDKINGDEFKNNDADLLIDRINIFEKEIINKIKCIMKIPAYDDNKIIHYLHVDTIYIDKEKKLRNIIEYQGKKNNLQYLDTTIILTNCRCKFLFHIQSIHIFENKIKSNIKLIRIFPESLDNLKINDKIRILEQINKSIFINLSIFNDLNVIPQTRRLSKKTVNEQLKKLVKFN